MTFFRGLAKRMAVAGQPAGIARARAQIARDRDELRRSLGADDDRLATTMTERSERASLVVGTTDLRAAYRLPAARLGGAHAWVSGATGSGKTRLVATLVDQVVARGLRGEAVAATVVDFKGDLAHLILRAFVARVGAFSRRERDRAIERLLVFAPFGRIIRPWQMLAREPSVSVLTQAAATVEVLEAAARLQTGPRQSDMLQAILATAIEQNWSLPETRFALDEPERLREAALRSAEPTLRVYAHDRLTRESAKTSDGLSARFDVLLAVDAVRATLAGPEAMDLRRAFEPGALAVLDFSRAPLGAEAAVRVLGALALIRLAWSIFDSTRRGRADLLLVADEVQVGLTPGVVAAIERIVTLGRSFGVGFLSAHQTVAQLPSELRSILATNVSTRILGRSSREDAEASVEWLPITRRVPRPRRAGDRRRVEPEFMSEAEERQHWVRELGRLENRRFLVSERTAPFLPRFVRSPDFDPPAWNALDPGLVREVFAAQGVPREEAFARARALEEEAAARILASREDDRPRGRGRRRGRAFETPDAVAAHDALERSAREVP